MKITKKELPKNQLELKIELEPKEYQEFLERAAQEMSKNTKIPGFRPGKASYDVLKQHLNEMHIFEHALNSILTHYYFEAITKEKLEPISHPKIDIEKMAIGNPLIFKAIINLIPDIKLGDINKIKVKKNKVEVQEEEINKAINTLRENQAKEVLEDKIIENSDKAEIDFTASIDGVVIEGGKEINYPLIVGKKQMIPGFEERLSGKKKGDEIEFKLKFPKQYKDIGDKIGDFKVKIKAVYKRTLPEANDEWAKNIFQAKNLKDLKDKLRKKYEAEKQRQEDQRIEMEIIERLIKSSEIGEFSDDLIKAEAQKMIEELKHNIEHQGLKFEDYLKQIKKKLEDLEKDFAPQAKKRLQSSLIIREIIKKENIKVDDKKADDEIKTMLNIYKDNKEMKKQFSSEEYKSYLKSLLLNKKVIEFLKEKTMRY